mgnify:CR=1 FL=1
MFIFTAMSFTSNYFVGLADLRDHEIKKMPDWVPDFSVGYNTSQRPFHTLNNSEPIYYEQTKVNYAAVAADVEYRARSQAASYEDAANGGGVTNWGTYLTGALLTAEDVYNNFVHNHTTYTTTQGVTKNIYKANGALRSARAGQFATASKVVQWTGITGTAFMTGVATYNIVDDVSNNRNVSGWDIADGSVGAVGLTGAGLTSVGIISNPVGWGVGAGVATYSWGRLWFDLGAKYGPSKWYGTNDYKWFE